MYYNLRDTFRSWQTILFFVILLGSSVFVFNVFIFNKYTAQTEVLFVANNLNQSRNYCYGDFGATFREVVKSETFLEDLNKRNELNIQDKNLKIKHFKKTDILRLKVLDNSPILAQKEIVALHKYITKNAQKYFAKNDFITVKTLMKPRLVDRQKEIVQRTLLGILVGLLGGLLIVWFTDFRLKLFGRKKSRGDMVREKIKEELTKKDKIKGKLYVDDEKYLFREQDNSPVLEDFTDRTVKRKEKQIQEPKVSKEKTTVLKSKKSEVTPKKIKARIISLNQFSPLESEKSSAPENLPIFVEEEYNRENTNEDEAKKEGRETGVIDGENKKGSKDRDKNRTELEKPTARKRSLRKEKPFIKSDLFIKETSAITQTSSHSQQKRVISQKIDKLDQEKRPSAHNIANGFAVDLDIAKKLEASEDIKDRLNKLLRGDL